MVAEFLKNGFNLKKSMCLLGVIQVITASLMITYIAFATPKTSGGDATSSYDKGE